MFNWSKNKRKIIFFVSIALILILFLIFKLNAGKNNNLVLYQVDYQQLSRHLFETGTVKQGEEISLSFSQGGKLEKLLVSEGDYVSANQSLVELEKEAFILDVEKSRENLIIAQADYQKLLTGLSEKEINYYKSLLDNATVALTNAEESLDEAKEGREEIVKQVNAEKEKIYDATLSLIVQAIDDGLDGLSLVTDLQSQYFMDGSQNGFAVAMAKEKAVFSLVGLKGAGYWNNESINHGINGARGLTIQAQATGEYGDIDMALEATTIALKDIRSALETINIYILSETDATILSAKRTSINTILASLNSQSQIINNYLVSADNSLAAAQRAVQIAERQVDSTDSAYQSALAQWNMKISPPRDEDRIFYSARVKQAEAELSLAEKKLREAILKAPFSGQIVNISNRPGEMVQAGQNVLKFRPETAFQIEVDIYEGEIGQIEVGQTVLIELVAFPDEILTGEVVFTDPSSRIINNVIYYPILIELTEAMDELRAGLTADVTIIIEEKENVLTVPEGALNIEEDRSFVRILDEEGLIEEREVEVGMKGEGFKVEIISGLRKGDQVIVR